MDEKNLKIIYGTPKQLGFITRLSKDLGFSTPKQAVESVIGRQPFDGIGSLTSKQAGLVIRILNKRVKDNKSRIEVAKGRILAVLDKRDKLKEVN